VCNDSFWSHDIYCTRPSWRGILLCCSPEGFFTFWVRELFLIRCEVKGQGCLCVQIVKHWHICNLWKWAIQNKLNWNWIWIRSWGSTQEEFHRVGNTRGQRSKPPEEYDVAPEVTRRGAKQWCHNLDHLRAFCFCSLLWVLSVLQEGTHQNQYNFKF